MAGEWKLLDDAQDGRVELYRLTDDPGERHNLAATAAAQASDLREQLNAWKYTVGAREASPNPDYHP